MLRSARAEPRQLDCHRGLPGKPAVRMSQVQPGLSQSLNSGQSWVARLIFTSWRVRAPWTRPQPVQFAQAWMTRDSATVQRADRGSDDQVWTDPALGECHQHPHLDCTVASASR